MNTTIEPVLRLAVPLRFLCVSLLLVALRGAESPGGFDIQAALDALPAAGGVVRIPAGTYELRQPLVIRMGDVKLEGAGTATHLINRSPDRQAAIVIKHADYPKVRKARLWRIMLADFRVSGSKESGDGIRAEGVDEIYLRGVAVDHHGGHGIVLRDCYEDPRLIGNIITYNGAAGLLLEGCHDIVVNANQFEENQDAVRCLDSFNLCMTGNNLDDHLRHGVVIENTYGSIVSSNMIEECNGTAILLDRDCYGITVAGNTIAHHLGGGVHLPDAWGCAITGNTFPLVHAGSIRVGPDSGRLTISGNTFSNSFIGGKNKRPPAHKDPMGRDAGTGILLEGTRDIAITGNTFGGLETPAVAARHGCQRLLITNNVIAEVNRGSPPGEPAIALGDATDCIVKDNLGAGPHRPATTP
ncbi:MAG: right-handed parallel beta-helix repeat-containing protein [Verrucomicrobia bacterium]|jgi:parallel beta-helix repeat protein|nr:right-handed parallel beta-helix repeat-containing protein [Verrucomicrobiota bacterium]